MIKRSAFLSSIITLFSTLIRTRFDSGCVTQKRLHTQLFKKFPVNKDYFVKKQNKTKTLKVYSPFYQYLSIVKFILQV